VSGAILDHVWQSTLFAAAIGVVARMFRDNSAALRYRLWLAASLKFLVPFALIAAAGERVGLPRVLPAAGSLVTSLGDVWSPQYADLTGALAQRTALAVALAWALGAVWLAGVAIVAVSWARQWQPVRDALRRATPVLLDTRVPTPGITVMVTELQLEPGIVGIWRPILLLPSGIAERLSRAQMDAIVAHEMCHFRRRDNLFAAVHMAVEALFWFHPLVWWIERQLIDERERACDQEVVRHGVEPTTYAEAILDVCRHYVATPLGSIARATGPDLTHRIEAIVANRRVVPLSVGKRACLALAAAAIVIGPAAAGGMKARGITVPDVSSSARASAPPAAATGQSRDTVSSTQPRSAAEPAPPGTATPATRSAPPLPAGIPSSGATAASPTRAQGTGSAAAPRDTGEIGGVVTDSAGEAIAGVAVEVVVHIGDTPGRTATTSADGSFAVPDLAPDAYDVVFRMPDYLTFKREGVLVKPGARAVVNAAMKDQRY
jgi:beta-lactamase regulating signal transducer with metallopeptidase domain